MSNFVPVSESRFGLGECILWDDRTGAVWWTDIHACALWRFDPRTRAERVWPLPQRLGCFALTGEDGVLLLGLENGLARFDSRDGELCHLQAVEPDLATTRINDGRCDRHGNFVFGTLNEGGADAIGGWYRYSHDGVLQRLDLPACHIANSLCFSPDGATLYFADSSTKRIMCCDYDAAIGAVRNIRLFHDLAQRYAGAAPDPDGSVIDAEGFLWNAEWGSGRVARYRPDGRLDAVFDLPASQPTCPAFGGRALDTLYLSSARVGLDDTALRHEPDAGKVWAWAAAPFRGLPEARFA